MNSSLEGKYLETYNQADRYVKLYSDYKETLNGNDCLIEILDLLLIAQEEEKDVEEVIGDDLAKFVSTVYRAYYPFSIVNYTYMTLLFSIAFAFMIRSVYDLFSIVGDNRTYASIFIAALIATLSGDLLKRSVVILANHSTRLFNLVTKRIPSTILNSLSLIILYPLITVINIGSYLSSTQAFLILLCSWIPGIVYVIKTDNVGEKSTTFTDTLYRTLNNQLDKKNRKLLSKGMPVLTNEEWMMKLKRRYRLLDIFTAILIVIYLALIIFIMYKQFAEGTDAVMVGLLIFLSLVVIFLMSYYFNKKHVNEYIKDMNDVGKKTK